MSFILRLSLLASTLALAIGCRTVDNDALYRDVKRTLDHDSVLPSTALDVRTGSDLYTLRAGEPVLCVTRGNQEEREYLQGSFLRFARAPQNVDGDTILGPNPTHLLMNVEYDEKILSLGDVEAVVRIDSVTMKRYERPGEPPSPALVLTIFGVAVLVGLIALAYNSMSDGFFKHN